MNNKQRLWILYNNFIFIPTLSKLLTERLFGVNKHYGHTPKHWSKGGNCWLTTAVHTFSKYNHMLFNKYQPQLQSAPIVPAAQMCTSENEFCYFWQNVTNHSHLCLSKSLILLCKPTLLYHGTVKPHRNMFRVIRANNNHFTPCNVTVWYHSLSPINISHIGGWYTSARSRGMDTLLLKLGSFGQGWGQIPGLQNPYLANVKVYRIIRCQTLSLNADMSRHCLQNTQIAGQRRWSGKTVPLSYSSAIDWLVTGSRSCDPHESRWSAHNLSATVSYPLIFCKVIHFTNLLQTYYNNIPSESEKHMTMLLFVYIFGVE